jgi:hypothetical protein
LKRFYTCCLVSGPIVPDRVNVSQEQLLLQHVHEALSKQVATQSVLSLVNSCVPNGGATPPTPEIIMFWRQQRASPGHGLLDIQFGSALHLPFNARLVDSIRNNPATAPPPMFDWDTSQPFLPWIEQVYPPVQGNTLAQLVERLIERTRGEGGNAMFFRDPSNPSSPQTHRHIQGPYLSADLLHNVSVVHQMRRCIPTSPQALSGT